MSEAIVRKVFSEKNCQKKKPSEKIKRKNFSQEKIFRKNCHKKLPEWTVRKILSENFVRKILSEEKIVREKNFQTKIGPKKFSEIKLKKNSEKMAK